MAEEVYRIEARFASGRSDIVASDLNRVQAEILICEAARHLAQSGVWEHDGIVIYREHLECVFVYEVTQPLRRVPGGGVMGSIGYE